MVSGFNDGEASVESLLAFTDELTDRVAFIPSHRLAAAKYSRLGRDYPAARTAEPAPKRLRRIAALAQAKGLRVSA